MAIAALVSGILGFVICYGIGPVLALIFGYTARRQIDESQGTQGGREMATAGIVMGWIGLALAVLFILFVAAMFAIPMMAPMMWRDFG